MKLHIARVFAAVLLILCFPLQASALAASDIESEAAVLMDASSGQVLFQKNPHKIMYPASTTKIMTGLLAAELCDTDKVAVVTESALDIDEWDSANISLIEGEKMTVNDLLYGMMLPSANDAANVIAEQCADNIAEFAELMTERAAAAGALNTHFENPHGLHGEGHYTTAYDMAMITREAIKNQIFMRYFSAPEHVIPETNLRTTERRLTNYQYMLIPDSDFYDPYVTGGKIGYTSDARHTMSTVKSRDGRVLIAVVLSSPDRDAKFHDTKKLFDFGMFEFIDVVISRESFEGFSTEITGKNGETEIISFRPRADFKALLHKSAGPDSVKITYLTEKPLNDGDAVGVYVDFTIKPQNPAIPEALGRLELFADYSAFVRSGSAPEQVGTLIPEDIFRSKWFIPALVVIPPTAIAASVLITFRINAYTRSKRRRERLEKLRQNNKSVGELVKK